MAERGIELTYTDKLPDLNAETLAKYDALAIYANSEKIEPDQEQALLDYVASGMGFIPVHSAISFLESTMYNALVGARLLEDGHLVADGEHVDERARQQQEDQRDRAGADSYVPSRLPASGKRVAIVGAGPAGLSTALHLLQIDPSWAERMLVLEKAAHPRNPGRHTADRRPCACIDSSHLHRLRTCSAAERCGALPVSLSPTNPWPVGDNPCASRRHTAARWH
jgi:hypothetical protein